MNRREIRTQVNNIMETLRNFNKSEVDSDELAEALFDELEAADEDEELHDAFFEFASMCNEVASK